MDHRRTISPAYYEKMAEAKAVFCSYCTLGAMLFWEDCEGCKIQRMFHAVQRTIKEEMPPKEQGAIVQEQNTYEGIDLPREMIESIGKGPATEGGFRTSPEFIIWEDGMYEAFRLQLVEEKTGLPDFAGTDDLPPTQSTLYYLRVICVERGQRTIMEAIQIWDTSYANEGRTYSIPAVSFFAASNEVPNFNDPQEKILEALYDRLDLKVVTADIAERDNRLAMLRKKQSGTAGNIAATITLDELKAMQREAAALPVPDSVHELADDILCALRENGIRVSDRKYLNYAPVAQAKAWLSGHAAVMPEDLLALKNYLWDAPQDRETVEQTLRRMCINPMQDKANNILAMALEAQDEFDEIRTGSDDPNVGRKAFIKLRGELIRLYGMQQQLAASTQGPNEAAVTDKLLEELEQSSRQAHEAVGFTYIPLEQQAALQ